MFCDKARAAKSKQLSLPEAVYSSKSEEIVVADPSHLQLVDMGKAELVVLDVYNVSSHTQLHSVSTSVT